jgi:DNA-binding SARP family transcriptional activator
MQNPAAGLSTGDVGALRLAVLGPPVVSWGEQVVAFRSRKELVLLVYLALTRTPQPRDHLAALLWPDQNEATARNALRTTLSRLREHLALAGGMPVVALPLLRTACTSLGRAVVELASAGSSMPATDVDRLVAIEAEGTTEAALEATIMAYRGPFLAGMHFADAPELEAWLDGQRAYWQRQVERALSRLASLQLGRHALAEANATARRWLALNALSEPAYRVLMHALAGAGDRAGALAVYEACHQVLRAQLAVEPAPETTVLAERLRRLSLPALTPCGSPPGDTPRQPDPHALVLPFMGREREFATLVAAYQATRAGQVQVVVLEGEAGSGKTRLVEEFLRWAMLEGADVLRGRGEEVGGSVPYQLLVDALRPRLAREHAPEDLVADVWLTELVRLFPELRERYPDLPPPATLAGDETGGPARMFEAVHQLILALAERARPGALVLCYDDMQWSDPGMRDLLLYRLRRQSEAGAPQLLVLTVQAEALARAPDLERWLVRLARQAPTIRLSLGPLSEKETTQALAIMLEDPTTAGAGQVNRLFAIDKSGTERLQIGPWLYAQSEGQPFYLVELVRALVDRGILVQREQGQAAPGGVRSAPLLALAPGMDRLPLMVPTSIHDLIHGQLGSLGAPAFAVLAAAAVLGADATFERLCLVADLDDRAGLTAIDELGRRRLMVETPGEPALEEAAVAPPAFYRFRHHLVREVVYTEAGETRRRLFHHRAFALLEGVAAPATLAYHAQGGCLGDQAVCARVVAANTPLAGPDATHPLRRQDWGEAPAIPVLSGRTEELAVLAGWVREEHCRVIQVLGAGGIGKTALTARLARDLAPEFEVIYWRSLRHALPPEEWLAGAIGALSAAQTSLPEGIEARLGLVLALLREHRTLLVLDNLETVLEPGAAIVRYQAGYEGYGEVLRRLAESRHQGCLMVTSREQARWTDEVAVRALRLGGLGVAAGQALLEGRHLTGDAAAWATLVERYSGNPLALQVAGEAIDTLFDGEIAAFLAQEVTVFGDIRLLLDEQVARLSPLERLVMIRLAVKREPVSFAELVADLGSEAGRGELVEAVVALRRRSLLEPGGRCAFTLQPVILEHATAQLVAQAYGEVLAAEPAPLASHALIKAQAKDSTRRSQERLIGQPLLEWFHTRLGDGAAVEGRLQEVLAG